MGTTSNTNRTCPKCAEIGHDKNGDHLYLLSDGETWYCNKPYHPPYLERDGEKIKKGKDNGGNKGVYGLSIEDIKELPHLGNKDRCISAETHSTFKVRTELSEVDRKAVACYYPETHKGTFLSYKQRKYPKKFSVIKDEHQTEGLVPDFFGQWRCPKSGRRLLICAGEEDTMAAYEMLKEKYPEYEPCVVGLPRGEQDTKTVAENLEFIKGFENVILAMDMDEAGRKALTKLAPIIGEGVLSLSISEKDVNEMKIKGKHKEFLNAYFSAKEYRPAHIVTVEDILEEAIAPVPWGLSYPWEQLTRLTYGMKEGGEIVGIGAAPGSGKSTIWQQIQKHLVFYHGQQIAIFDIEEGPVTGLKKLIGSVMNLPIHKPDCVYDMDKAKEIGQRFSGLTHFYGGDSENWEEVESAIRYYISKGIRFYFIDPLSAVVEHLNASDANTELGKIMRSMRRLRKQQGITIFHANHLNNPKAGKEHGEGGKVLGSQFSGSRAQWKYSTLLLGYERDQYADDRDERDKGVLRVIKDRLGGNTGTVRMKYDQETGGLEEDTLLQKLEEE